MRWGRVLLMALAVFGLVVGGIAFGFSWDQGALAEWRGERAASRIDLPDGWTERRDVGTVTYDGVFDGHPVAHATAYYPAATRPPDDVLAAMAGILRAEGRAVRGPEDGVVVADTPRPPLVCTAWVPSDATDTTLLDCSFDLR